MMNIGVFFLNRIVFANWKFAEEMLVGVEPQISGLWASVLTNTNLASDSEAC